MSSGTGTRNRLIRAAIRPGSRSRRLAVAVLLAALAAASLATGPAAAAGPRVAIVVGPAGAATEMYRVLADVAAATARAYGASVIEVTSPNATWPSVRAALQGASIVVYLGHGNGFPSRYSATLNRETQDGLGLNPVAGVDDVAHRYFGEAYLAREVKLAPNAIVLLHRLCYASGNSEPGLPESTLPEAEARADNFAAGFLAAGGGAVIADAFARPSTYVEAILSSGAAGGRTIEAIWRSSPTYHGHVHAFTSVRTPGAAGLLDPTTSAGEFYRSIVGRLGLRPGEIGHPAIEDSAGQPDDARSGPAVAGLRLNGTTVAGGSLRLTVSLASGKDLVAPAALVIGTRWIPLDVESPAAVGVLSPRPTRSPATAPTMASRRSSPGTTAAPDASFGAQPPLVAEEPAGLVTVAPSKAQATGNDFAVPVGVPAAPGHYRLVVTLHDAAGVAYDAATQAAVPALLVHVFAPLAATISAPGSLSVEAGVPIAIELAIANPGRLPWTGVSTAVDGAPAVTGVVTLVGRWVGLDPGASAVEPLDESIVAPAPGATTGAILTGRAPARPGTYLLEIDLVSPTLGSFVWSGALEPVLVRVTVLAPDARRK